MPIYQLDERIVFPNPRETDPASGIIAVGGDLSADRLLLAYSIGIFPWYSDSTPILWHCPNERMVLFPAEFRINRSLRKTIKRQPYRLTLDTAFAEVMQQCATVPRFGQSGTWITDDMLEAYVQLHELGFAHSVEAWQDEELVGGLYGVSLGSAFFGESMFALQPDASKVAFATLVAQLLAWGCELIDCQVYTDHLARFGAREISRNSFLDFLPELIAGKTHSGQWSFSAEVIDGAIDILTEHTNHNP